MSWKLLTFDEAIESNPKVFVKKGEFVENCEMEDIEPMYRYLYPREGKVYHGSNSKFQNGDTVFAKITPCLENGKIAQIKYLKNNKGIGSTEFLVFRARNGVSDSDFVYYLSKSDFIRDTAVNSMSGASGRQRADLKAIKNIKLLLPSLIEQRQIASVLSNYDDLIEVNNQRIKLLEETARELYKEWFVRMRFPGYLNIRFVKGIPDGWQIERLNNLLDFRTGKLNSNAAAEDGEYPFFTCSNNDFKVKTYSFDTEAVLLAGNNANGIFPLKYFKGRFDAYQRTYVIKPKINTLSHKYVYFYFLERLDFLQVISIGAATQFLTTQMLKKMWMVLPSSALMEEFALHIDPLFEHIHILKRQNAELLQIRDRLLPRLISGKLKVKIAEEIPCL